MTNTVRRLAAFAATAVAGAMLLAASVGPASPLASPTQTMA